MMKTPITILALISCLHLFAQQRIDSSFAFQTDTAKKYSLYIPGSYSPGTPNKLMVGLHPFNVSRWNAITWCDTLINFAEMNGLILMCPDGGLDGQVDDNIDTAFTSALMDSVFSWYTIETDSVFLMGFSWGGKTTYSYGLLHAHKFRGFMPIGAALGISNEIDPFLATAPGKPFYLIHGSNDNTGLRFYPPLNALTDTGACVNSLLMPGVGHTIDFPNRDQILTDAFVWLDTVNCTIPKDTTGDTTSIKSILPEPLRVSLYPNPVGAGERLTLNVKSEYNYFSYAILDLQGKLIRKLGIALTNMNIPVNTRGLSAGVYFVQVELQGRAYTRKFTLNK